MRATRRRSDQCKVIGVFLGITVLVGAGCSASRFSRIDSRQDFDIVLAAQTRFLLQEQPAFPDVDGNRPDAKSDDLPEYVEREDGPAFGEVFLGELIAIFPGAIVPGLGHYYAGDYRTSAQLRRVGGLGIALTAVGGGLAAGGHFLDEDEDVPDGYAYGLYGAGGTVGVIGLAYYLTGWIYDIIDTPRAIRSGGKPPPRSKFVEGLDLFSR